MSKIGKDLILAIQKAKDEGLITLQASPDVAALRKKLRLSQLGFAKKYHINPETVKKWEQHRREPDSISRAYLKCIAKNPKVIEQLVNS
jgi:putative transcriptional regulator